MHDLVSLLSRYHVNLMVGTQQILARRDGHRLVCYKNKRRVTGSFSNSDVTRTEKLSLSGLIIIFLYVVNMLQYNGKTKS